MRLSVIIPTYNRCTVLQKCLKALLAQKTRPSDFEIIICDDGSRDDTEATIAGYIEQYPNRIRYLRQSNAGANAARNNAIRHAKGEILLIINDDTIATENMVNEHLAVHDKYPDETVAVLGKVTISPDVPFSLFAQLHLDAMFDLWAPEQWLDWRAFYTCNVSVKKNLLLRYGLFEEKMRYHEDVELSQRLSLHGLRLFYNSKALGFHDHLLQEEEYLVVARREGEAIAYWLKKSPHIKSQLGEFGLYPYWGVLKCLKYYTADIIFNHYVCPLWIKMARFFSRHHQSTALILYQKIFQSIRRQAIRRWTTEYIKNGDSY